MTFAAQPVKKMAVPVLSTLALCTTALAPSAYASGTRLIEKTVTVEIRLSDLKTETGMAAAYAKIKKRAKSFCRSDIGTLQYLEQSKADCMADLVNQFVESADVAALKAYHKAQMSVDSTKVAEFYKN